MTKPEVSTADLREALGRRLESQKGWYVFDEVQAGPGVQRFADVVAVQTYWSRGIKVEAYELKSYRSDWLQELKNPDKAEAIAKHCDRFYIVAAPGIVKLEEVPAGWGFLECRPPSNRLRQLKAAPDLQDTTRKQVSLGMFIGILRAAERAWWKPTSAQMEKVAREARAAGYESGKESAARGPGDQQREIARLQGIIRDFEQRAKVSIHEYNAGEIGSIVELVSMLDGRYNLLSRVEQADRVLTAALAEVRKAIAALAKEKVT